MNVETFIRVCTEMPASSDDPDQTSRSTPSVLDVRCLNMSPNGFTV